MLCFHWLQVVSGLGQSHQPHVSTFWSLPALTQVSGILEELKPHTQREGVGFHPGPLEL